MNEAQLDAELRDWWKQSFPHAPLGKHAITSHVAWAQHLLQKINHEQQRQEQPR